MSAWALSPPRAGAFSILLGSGILVVASSCLRLQRFES